jgi:hypothetical protein
MVVQALPNSVPVASIGIDDINLLEKEVQLAQDHQSLNHGEVARIRVLDQHLEHFDRVCSLLLRH